jgi:D-tyrosyl-tRNA(Tyr) deacylase
MRVTQARVSTPQGLVAQIGRGLLALVGAQRGDGPEDVRYVARRLSQMRVFGPPGQEVSVTTAGGEVLVVSQFTLLGSLRRGRRPDFFEAMPREEAEGLVAQLVGELRAMGVRTQEGAFGAYMQVESVNDGPYTLWLDSREAARGGTGSAAHVAIGDTE